MTRQLIGGGFNSHGAAVINNLYRSPDGTISTIDLGTCTFPGLIGVTQGINDHGWVIGDCTEGFETFGFLWKGN